MYMIVGMEWILDNTSRILRVMTLKIIKIFILLPQGYTAEILE